MYASKTGYISFLKVVPDSRKGEHHIPIFFTDVDGTIRRSKSGEKFVKDINDIELFPGADDRLNRFASSGYIVVAVSNQGGVAYGYRTVEEVHREMEYTLSLFQANPISLAIWAYPYDGKKENPYRHRSLYRKPRPGMAVMAETFLWDAGYTIDWDRSIVLGDRKEDQGFAERSGIKFFINPEYFYGAEIQDLDKTLIDRS